MKFDIPRKEHPNLERYNKQDIELGYKFSNELYKELGSMIRASVMFGSSARGTTVQGSDLDMMIILDDLLMSLNREVIEAYRVIVQRLIVKHSTRIHVTTLRFTSFWEYVRNGDPVAINILRDGVALIDSGFFDPLQALLKRGKIRPSQESIWSYYVRAPNTLHNSRWHLLQATLDLYWGVVDSAHAALMKVGEIPPTPGHVADMMEHSLVKKGLVERKYVFVMKNFYKLMKMITHGQKMQVKGEEFERYFAAADDFVRRMKLIIEGK
ncbi:nucleotidyltransferase domain-containing protein [Candidatus Woesearchaeota archaeon]|nr:nucleotidyltransferase domain-containing protein [Candidatus Woesearchaeota archaeon]